MNRRIFVKSLEQLLAKQKIGGNGDHSKDSGVNPGTMYSFLRPFSLTCRDILADHRYCGILDAYGNLIDNIIDSQTHTEGCGSYHINAVDHRIDKEHGDVDAACLNGHRRA